MISFAAFEGDWRITRQITDHLSGTGQFTGSARLTPEGAGGLLYTEEGSLTLATGESFAATRSYHWAQEPEGGGVSVRFSDGGFFHRFSLRAQAEAAHFCGPDQYDVTYDFADWPRWQARWRVTGPRKDYVMTSHYTRHGAT